jgi:hypothetical protein
MGFLCCRSDDRDHSAFSSSNNERKATLNGTTTAVTNSYNANNYERPTGAAASSPSPPAAGAQNSDDEVSMDFFFDAAQSFSDVVGSLLYAPTAVMRRSVILVDGDDDDHIITKVRRVSIQQPDTLLSSSFQSTSSWLIEEEEEEEQDNKEDEMHSAALVPSETETTTTKQTSMLRESIVQITNQLQKQHVRGSQQHQQPGQRRPLQQGGYPGELTPFELEACLKFRQQLKEGDVALKEVVHAYLPMEDEAFALCRILRGEAFMVEKVFAKFQEKNVVELWQRAKQNNFWTDFEAHFHCPLPVFLKLYPIVSAGLAKNGCTVWYLKTSQIDIDGIECIVDLPNIMPYFWQVLHDKGKIAMKREMKQTDDHNTTTVLAERIFVIDMQGIPWVLFGSSGMEVFKDAAKATACFPEILNRMYLVNVPMTFSVVWAILKLFIDPRTIQKIGFFASASKAKRDLLRYVSSDQLLSNFGGQGPSYHSILEERQQEYGNYQYSRYVVQTMGLVKLKETSFSISLHDNEQVGNITIYSQNDDGALFTVTSNSGGSSGSSNNNILTDSITVSRNASGGGTRKHYSVEIPCNNHPILVGPVKVTVHAKMITDTTAVGNFLVAISISNNEQR